MRSLDAVGAIRNARLRDGMLCDLVLDGGRVVERLPAGESGTSDDAIDAGGGLTLPAFVNVHLHLDKTRLGSRLPPDRTGTIQDGLEITHPQKAAYTVEDVTRRASEVLDSAVVHGAGFVRGFTDVDPIGGLVGVETLLELKEAYAGRLDMQVSAFAQEAMFRHEGTEDLFRKAASLGVDVIAGCPQIERDPALVRRHVETCFEIAVEHDLDLHFLADDTDDPSSRSLEVIADCTADAGWNGRVIVGHAGALAAYDHTHAVEVIGRLRRSGVVICTNPQISLTLMGREDRGLIRRGTTRINELLAGGVSVIAAQDDVDDPYYPFGIPSQLEVAKYTAHVAHLTHPAGLETVMDMVTGEAAAAVRLEGYGLEPGDRADVVVLPVETASEALRLTSVPSWVLHRGRLVASTEVSTWVASS
jgi:cytosine deaminase